MCLTLKIFVFNETNVIICPLKHQDRANTLFKQVHEGKSLRGRSNDAISAACLYMACRQEQVPRTYKGNYPHLLFQKFGAIFAEICAVSRSSKKDIGRTFKLILKFLETSVELITSGDFMVRNQLQEYSQSHLL